MYKVMIVDDEEPVLESFAFIMDKDVRDFVLCGKARSGTEALRLIPELTPDLIFMDIQMPGIDGLEVIKQIRPQFPNIVFILATAYERFDIAQKAIPLGVFSYMVKPISKKKLLKEFSEVKNHLDVQKERELRIVKDVQLLNKTKVEEKDRFLRGIMWRDSSKKLWDDFLHHFDIECEKGRIFLLEIVGDISEDIKKDVYKSVLEKIQFKYNCLGTVVTGRIIMFFPEERTLNNLSYHAKKILDGFNSYNFLLGEGSVHPLSQLHSSFSEAFLPFAEASEVQNTKSAKREQTRLICTSILNGDTPLDQHLFVKYWNEIFNKYPFKVALGKMVALFTMILERLDYQILAISDFDIDPANEIMALNNFAEWEEWSSQALIRLQELIRVKLKQSYPGPLTTALAYIQSNYQKTLQLSDVAEESNVTGSYLSRLFPEYLGTTFIDYLNRYRLNKAVILLEEKKYSIKEIAYMVGYKDPNYFSRIFRKQMGFSPSSLDKEGIKK